MPLGEPNRVGIVVEGAPGGRSERPLAFRQKKKCNGALRAPQGVGVCVCVYLFNGRRPVPITRVLNIPCWDKSRQEVRPGLQCLCT
jgi:hypothetical protein